jgi:hypothetical protein
MCLLGKTFNNHMIEEVSAKSKAIKVKLWQILHRSLSNIDLVRSIKWCRPTSKGSIRNSESSHKRQKNLVINSTRFIQGQDTEVQFWNENWGLGLLRIRWSQLHARATNENATVQRNYKKWYWGTGLGGGLEHPHRCRLSKLNFYVTSSNWQFILKEWHPWIEWNCQNGTFVINFLLLRWRGLSNGLSNFA